LSIIEIEFFREIFAKCGFEYFFKVSKLNSFKKSAACSDRVGKEQAAG